MTRALVTGGASGIGAALAAHLADGGAEVIVADLDIDRAREVAASIGGVAVGLDVGDADAWDSLVADHGPFDVVCLNAGTTTNRDVIGPSDEAIPPLTNVTLDAYRRIMAANVDGVVLGARAVIPGMCERRSGDIVVTASIASFVPIPPDPVYGLTKYAVSGLVKSLAPRLADYDVCISAICPGFVDTPLLSERAREWVAAIGLPLMSTERVVEAARMALVRRVNGAHWLVTPDADPVIHDHVAPPFPTNAG